MKEATKIGIVPTMINEAYHSKIELYPLRRNISVLEGSGGNVAGLPVENLPNHQVTSADETVDASLAGLAQGEFVYDSYSPQQRQWEVFEAARQALFPNLSRDKAADRYQVALDLQKRA